MKNKYIIYACFFLIIINISVLGSFLYFRWNGDDEKYPPMPGGERGYEIVMRTLEMNPDQKKQFLHIREDFRSDIDSLDVHLRLLNEELLKEIWSPQPDSTQIDAIIREIGTIQTASQYRVLRHFSLMKTFLSEDQWEAFYGIVSKRYPAARGFPAPQQMELNGN